MSSKRKGIKKEWELKKYLEKIGYLVLRSSASKTGIDLLAGNGKEVIAIQVQTSEYISKDKLEELKKYAFAFNAKPVIAIKTRKGWIFAQEKDLEKTGKMFKIRIKETKS